MEKLGEMHEPLQGVCNRSNCQWLRTYVLCSFVHITFHKKHLRWVVSMSQMRKLRLGEMNWLGLKGKTRIPTELWSLAINYSNYGQKHFRAHCLPDPVHSAFRILSCLSAIIMFWGTQFYLHFLDSEAEAQRATRAQTLQPESVRVISGWSQPDLVDSKAHTINYNFYISSQKNKQY